MAFKKVKRLISWSIQDGFPTIHQRRWIYRRKVNYWSVQQKLSPDFVAVLSVRCLGYPFDFQTKKQVKGIVSLLQIFNYFSHCFKERGDFTFACEKNSFCMKIRIMMSDDVKHPHSFFPIDFRILGKERSSSDFFEIFQ